MNKYFWVGGKSLLYKAFYRYGLIPHLDSQQPPLGPGVAIQLCGLLPLLANCVNVHLRHPGG